MLCKVFRFYFYVFVFKENLKFIPEFVFLLSLIHIFANHPNSNFLAQFDNDRKSKTMDTQGLCLGLL